MDIVIIGVGGQGTLLASRVLGAMAILDGLDVKVSEVHGMSQRGGSVVTYVRSGKKVESPIIENGQADIVLAFEQLEAFRALPYLKKGGRVLSSTQRIMPMPVITGAAEYPSDILNAIKEKNISITAVDALEKAEEAGSSKCANTVMLGALCRILGEDENKMLEIVGSLVPPKTAQMNRKAFMLGYEAGGNAK